MTHPTNMLLLPQDRYNVLIEFAHRHLEFQRPELESVLRMHGLVLGVDYVELPLPSSVSSSSSSSLFLYNTNTHEKEMQNVNGVGQDTSSSSTTEFTPAPEPTPTSTPVHTRPFLILSFPLPSCNNKNTNSSTTDLEKKFPHNNFRLDGIQNDTPFDSTPPTSTSTPTPTLTSLLTRCTLIRCAIELWGVGTSLEQCAHSIQHYLFDPNSVTSRLFHIHDRSTDNTQEPYPTQCKEEHGDDTPHHDSSSWKMTIQTLGWKSSLEEQEIMRNHFHFLPFHGTVKMKDPEKEYILLREVELDVHGSAIYPRYDHDKQLIPHHDTRPPLGIYFGRILGGIRNWRSQCQFEKYSLKNRIYLGPTSMDTELSFIMTNLAQVRPGSFCFDPFVGTGSILLTCGLRGAALCFGTDIDLRVLRGKSQHENIHANFQQFHLSPPELVRSDNSIFHRHYRCQVPIFDCIVTDPPYGIRAGARKSGSKLSQPRPVPDQYRYDHIAQTQPYAVSNVMADLFDVAARTLVLGGRLVYILPSMADFQPETDLPRHECLQIRYVCYQPLQAEYGRRVVTMEKVKEYDESLRDVYMSQVWVNGAESAEKCANIRERLMSLAKEKEGYEERLQYRKEKRKLAKEKKKALKRNMAEEEEDDDDTQEQID